MSAIPPDYAPDEHPPEPSRISVVICAAGASRRMGGGIKKEYRLLPGAGAPCTVLDAAIQIFATVPSLDHLVVAAPPDGEASVRAAIPGALAALGSRIGFIPGGATRRMSVHHGLMFLAAYRPDYVLIHDGARPWVDRPLIERVCAAALHYGAAIPLLPLTDTPKEIADTGFVVRHLSRVHIGVTQTPQCFAFPPLLAAHALAAWRERHEGIDYTDDAQVWGEFAGPVATVPGSPGNRKITFEHDLYEEPHA